MSNRCSWTFCYDDRVCHHCHHLCYQWFHWKVTYITWHVSLNLQEKLFVTHYYLSVLFYHIWDPYILSSNTITIFISTTMWDIIKTRKSQKAVNHSSMVVEVMCLHYNSQHEQQLMWSQKGPSQSFWNVFLNSKCSSFGKCWTEHTGKLRSWFSKALKYVRS